MTTVLISVANCEFETVDGVCPLQRVHIVYTEVEILQKAFKDANVRCNISCGDIKGVLKEAPPGKRALLLSCDSFVVVFFM